MKLSTNNSYTLDATLLPAASTSSTIEDIFMEGATFSVVFDSDKHIRCIISGG